MYGKCVPVLVAALTVVVLGKTNPALLQKKVNGKASGEPDPVMLALAAAASGLATCGVMKLLKDKDAFDLS